MDWKKCGKFIMKVASDVLLLLCLHDFGLWVSVGLGQVFLAVLHVVSAWIGLTEVPYRSAV